VETCWFCEQEPATPATQLRTSVYGPKQHPPPSNGRQIDLSGQTARVDIPVARCSRCASLQRSESSITISGLVLGIVLFAGPYALAAYQQHPPFAFFGSVTATLVVLAILGFLVGLGCGVLVAFRINRTMKRKHVRTHPDVVALTDRGWSWEAPNID